MDIKVRSGRVNLVYGGYSRPEGVYHSSICHSFLWLWGVLINWLVGLSCIYWERAKNAIFGEQIWIWANYGGWRVPAGFKCIPDKLGLGIKLEAVAADKTSRRESLDALQCNSSHLELGAGRGGVVFFYVPFLCICDIWLLVDMWREEPWVQCLQYNLSHCEQGRGGWMCITVRGKAL